MVLMSKFVLVNNRRKRIELL